MLSIFVYMLISVLRPAAEFSYNFDLLGLLLGVLNFRDSQTMQRVNPTKHAHKNF